jgi:hypothetical protein
LRRQPSLRSQLNQIRLWVRQGRTDAWIAHKLDVSIEQLERFKRDHDLLGEEAAPGRPADPLSVPPPDLSLYEDEEDEEDEEADEEAEDEKPVGALLDEPGEEDEDERPARDRSRDRSRSRSRGGRGRGRERSRASGTSRDSDDDVAREDDGTDDETDDGKAAPARRRRRGRRGGRGRRRATSFEATFDHGEDGYGLWLDPAVVDNPIYAQHWAGHREIEVTVDQDAITIRRARTGSDDADRPPEDDEDQ